MFSVKGQILNILGFAGHMLATTQFCLGDVKSVIDAI